MMMFTEFLYDWMFDQDGYTWMIIRPGKAELIMDLQLLDC